MTRGLRTVAPPRPQRGMAEDNDIAVPQLQQSNSARTKNGTHLRFKYSLLAPEDPEGD